MKKKISFALLCFIVLLGLSGCGKNIINDSYTNSNDNGINETQKINCPILKNIKLVLVGNRVITNNDELYSFGYYSDDTNCKKFETNGNRVNIEKVIENYIVDNKKNVYRIDNYNYSIELREDLTDDYIKYFIDLDDVIKVPSLEYLGNINVLMKDGIIYKYNIEKNYSENRINLIEKKIYQSFDGEKIIDFDPDSVAINWIKTDKSYFVRVLKNPDCWKYDDSVKCEYELIKSEELTKKYKDIAYITGEEGNYSYVLKDGTKTFLNFN